MGAFAARVSDTTAHGGIILPPGAPTVLIEGMPAARVSDMHTCALVNPGPVPHVGGPILPPGAPTVLIGFMPAARVTDWAVCVGPMDVIVLGAKRTMIGMPAAAPPPPPSVSPGGSGRPSWLYDYQWVAWHEAGVAYNWGGVAQAAVAVAYGAAAGAVVTVAVVVYPFVSRSAALPVWPDSGGRTSDLVGNLNAFHENTCQEGVREDAEMYFLR